MIKILKYGSVPDNEIFSRREARVSVAETVSEIIENVKENGDMALRYYSSAFDRAEITDFAVSKEEIEQAVLASDPEFIRILERAASNIRRFHSKQKRKGFEIREPDGTVIGQKIIPVDRVGLYVPGGTAAYPSTVLMNSIPARIAGCPEGIMVTPPQRDGKINPAILAAAHVAGVDRIFKVGGAQAIAALAYGTESIPRVDKIVGPGNAFVAEAKRQVFGIVSIDMIAGPSEIMIIADGKSDPAVLAADMLSQAEHDKNASAVLITDSEPLAAAVSAEIEKQLHSLEREETARASIDANGRIIISESLAEAVEIANRLAPEHLEICTDDPFELFEKVRHAGSVFLGRNCPEAVGDYMAGTNHTLPTGGTARFSSPLSVDDFIKKTQYTFFTEQALSDIDRDVAFFARREGLTAHAKSALIRAERKNR
ncbi:MAG: histidinol dehydrogenase [Clostridia bacterium]|nr:histidinol dehydrogenase [Clostridia bacterium]